MADSRITDLAQISTIDSDNDQFVIVDVSDKTMDDTGTSKRLSLSQIYSAIQSVRPMITTGAYTDPNGVVSAAAGSIYFDLSNPSSPVQWIKTAGTGNTGWI